MWRGEERAHLYRSGFSDCGSNSHYHFDNFFCASRSGRHLLVEIGKNLAFLDTAARTRGCERKSLASEVKLGARSPRICMHCMPVVVLGVVEANLAEEVEEGRHHIVIHHT